MEKTTDSNYIQQHLANERTFLAWVRTGIAIIGVGFLFSNLHFSVGTSLSEVSDLLAVAIGVLSGVIGIIVIIAATISYILKRKQINQQTFRSSKWLIISMAIISIAIIFVYIIYNML
jgi:putative membrane protein